MTCLTGEVEENVLPAEERRKHLAVSNVGDGHGDTRLDLHDVRAVSTMPRKQGIDEMNLCPCGYQLVSEVGADEAQPSDDQDALPAKWLGKVWCNHVTSSRARRNVVRTGA